MLLRPPRSLAGLALVLALLGALVPGAGFVSFSGSNLALDCGIDACGCPPNLERDLCCCAIDPERTPDTGRLSRLAQLMDGQGCDPELPEALSASPAGPIIATGSSVDVPSTDTPVARALETQRLSDRAARPPVPPPRA